MSNPNQILSAYMDNIIQLLQNLVRSVKENNDLLQKNQNLLLQTNKLIQNISSNDSGNIPELSNSLEKIVGQLQKGVQTFQLNSMLDDIKDMMKNLGYSTKPKSDTDSEEDSSIESSEITQEFKTSIKSNPKKDDDDHVIRPSSFY